MRQLTLKGDYAVRAVVDLATGPAGAPVRIRDLGRRTGVPRSYLCKIVQALARASLVRTRRGPGGGVTLAPPPEAISLRQILEAVEGPLYLDRCLVRTGLPARDRACAVNPVWSRIQQLLTRELDAIRVRDLVEAARRPAAERARVASAG